MSSNITLISFLLAALASTAFGQAQKAVLYDQYNGNGNYIVVPEDYVEDLSQLGWDNKPLSVCVTGIWMFYQNNRYNYDRASGMEYVFGRSNYCVNLNSLAGYVSSLRYAGNPKSYLEDSFTLYQNDYFQGAEEYVVQEAPNLNPEILGDHKSIIITGKSDWTIFDLPNFQGNDMCLRRPDANDDAPHFISDIQNNKPDPIPYGAIRSVRKGCRSQPTNTINLQSFARSNHKSDFAPPASAK